MLAWLISESNLHLVLASESDPFCSVYYNKDLCGRGLCQNLEISTTATTCAATAVAVVHVDVVLASFYR